MGYTTLIFFYLLYNVPYENNEKISLQEKNGIYHELTFSNAFLPINASKHIINGSKDIEDGYLFSNFYPTGIYEENGKVIVTLGEGDFYTTELTFELQNIKDAAMEHNFKNMDFNNFKYYFMQFKKIKSGDKEVKGMTLEETFNYYGNIDPISMIGPDKRVQQKKMELSRLEIGIEDFQSNQFQIDDQEIMLDKKIEQTEYWKEVIN